MSEQDLKTVVAVHENRLDHLEESDSLQWATLTKVKETLTAVKVQLGVFGVTHTLLIAWIAYKITKGA